MQGTSPALLLLLALVVGAPARALDREPCPGPICVRAEASPASTAANLAGFGLAIGGIALLRRREGPGRRTHRA